jgi:2-succinyl-6-hydroxy-2,4-cyclohexadiene-1-carboxylate synthase
MKDIKVNAGGITLQVRDYESPGQTILFFHFGGGNLMMWLPIVKFFVDTCRLILVDLRDHGKSEKPHTDGHIDTIANDIAELIIEMNLNKVHVVGSSLGAEVGLSLAANHPEKVLSLVCDGATSNEYGEFSCWQDSLEEFSKYKKSMLDSVRNPDQTYDSPKELVEAMKNKLGQNVIWNDWFETFFTYDAYEVSPGVFTRSWQNKAKELYFETYFNSQFQNYYNRITCPVMILTSDEEYNNELSRNAMHGLINKAKKGRISVVPGWSHPYGWMEDPTPVCENILNFYKEIKPDIK